MTDDTRAADESSRPAAVLWDMDGTLVDTEPYWLIAETELVHAWGGTWTEADGLTLVGSSLDRSARVLQSRGVQLTPDEIIGVLTERVVEQLGTAIPWRPGARELLTEVHKAGIRTALVTMSQREMADYIATHAGFPAFEVVVSGDDVEHGKPDPEAYLRAASLLGVNAEDCVAIEDSEFGVAAAVASGATTIAAPLMLPLPESPVYTLWNTLEGKTVEDLLTLHAAVAR